MTHDSEPTADSPQPEESGDGGLHDAPTRSAAAQRHAGLGAALSAPLPAGAVFGHYTIEAVLGEGGMGVVYRARQERPAREVALKVIRPGLASSQALRRFELEAEALGRLQHPGIAQIYEAGTSKEGQPFFAMELVRGESLIRYAASRDLNTRQRLELFAKVCEAVQHAHTKGVIHRDLKPVNILVDSSGQPKILDFGVARVTQHDVQAATIQTDIGQIIGTVPYMSPEQIEGDPANLDTRSDVYALGVILYELLTGRMPYDLSKKLIHEAARIIQEDEPTRLSSINRALRGDIETIALKALEKDKARRYQAASDLGSDITRFLRSEPIAARPASRSYQLRKFAKRNKTLVGGVLAAFVLLALGLAGTSWGLIQARQQRDRADERADAALKAEAEASAARDAEKARAEELQRVSDFQSTMLRQIDPTRAGSDLMTDIRERFAAGLEKAGVPEDERAGQSAMLQDLLGRVNATDTAAAMIDRAILKPAVKAIDEKFKDQPVVDAQLREALADVYRAIGLYDQSFLLQESALTTRRRVLGDEHPQTLVSISKVGEALEIRGKLAESEPYFREALEKSRRVRGEDHPETLAAINNMGFMLASRGRFAEAEPYYREALEKRRAQGDEAQGTLLSLSNMGLLLKAQGKFADAEPYLREALEKRRRVLGEDHPDTLDSISIMGALLSDQGKPDQAEAFYREALEKRRRVSGEEHPNTLTAINNMGFVLSAQGRLAEAEPYYRESLEKCRRVRGEDHPETLTAINNMGQLLWSKGNLADAEPYYRDALERRRRVLGEAHPMSLQSANSLGVLLSVQGKFPEAERSLRDTVEVARRVLGAQHPQTLRAINNLAAVLEDQGRLADSEPYYREVLEGSRSVLGDEHPSTLNYIVNLCYILQALGKSQEAIELLDPAEPVARRLFKGDSPAGMGVFLTILGRARVDLGYEAQRLTLAEANLLEAHPNLVEFRGPTHKITLECVQGLVDLYTTWDAAEPGKGYDLKAAEWKAKLDGSTNGEAH